MTSRRTQVLDAAVRLVAEGGVRRLTHRGVDAGAGLPSGSTSNLFRTRAALTQAILEHLLERERAVLGALTIGDRGDAAALDVLTGLAAGMITDALGAGREQTMARRALFLEAAQHPAVSEQLEQATAFWWDLVARLLRSFDVPDEHRRARWLLAYLDGIISDQLARPQPDFDPRAALSPAVYGILQQPAVHL